MLYLGIFFMILGAFTILFSLLSKGDIRKHLNSSNLSGSSNPLTDIVFRKAMKTLPQWVMRVIFFLFGCILIIFGYILVFKVS